MSQEKFTFQAEVSRLLDIVTRSLYSHKEIFLRELISNSSDACDKLRYEALTQPDLGPGDGFTVRLAIDAKAKTLSVSDNGIGMNHDELIATLGTIANSGTLAFVEQMTGDKEKDMSLIGQFGVGFYSAFMVAGKVDVLTRRAGEDTGWLWSSDGTGEYTIDEAAREHAGTTVTLHLNKDEKEFLEDARIRTIVKKYSDHVAIPIILETKDGEDTLNEASALWTRPKKDISDEQYKEFYHHSSHAFDEPWMTIHNSVEGVLSYTNLLFIPTAAPFDLFHPERKHHVKLYVNRVFISDNCEGLMPSWLRFVHGVVDSEDLSLNVSRELLQQDPKLRKISTGLIKRVLGELKKSANKKPDEYAEFWKTFGGVLKEGLYEQTDHRERMFDICRFNTTQDDNLTSLDAYIERMPEGQKAIYTITGENLSLVSKSPQLEGFRSRGIEVLLLTDAIDEFWVPSVGTYKDIPFKSVTQGGDDLDAIKGKDDKDDEKPDTPAGMEALIGALKTALEGSVSDVRVSNRLTDSPVCLIADAGGMDIRLEQFLKQHQQMEGELSPRVLEINPGHGLIKKLAKVATDDVASAVLIDAAGLLLDQARIIEGEPLADPVDFSRRMTSMMEKGL